MGLGCCPRLGCTESAREIKREQHVSVGGGWADGSWTPDGRPCPAFFPCTVLYTTAASPWLEFRGDTTTINGRDNDTGSFGSLAPRRRHSPIAHGTTTVESALPARPSHPTALSNFNSLFQTGKPNGLSLQSCRRDPCPKPARTDDGPPLTNDKPPFRSSPPLEFSHGGRIGCPVHSAAGACVRAATPAAGRPPGVVCRAGSASPTPYYVSARLGSIVHSVTNVEPNVVLSTCRRRRRTAGSRATPHARPSATLDSRGTPPDSTAE